MKWIVRKINGLPKYYNDVWYNKSAYISEEKYPVIFDENNQYIDCKIGLQVKMGETPGGRDIFYEVVKMWGTRGSDFLYSSDSTNCKLKFSHIK